MEKLFTPLRIRRTEVKNRICVPPMVCYGWAGEDGCVTADHIAHYRALAAGGAGLIIQEATCICPEGRLSTDQLGLWCDEQIEGHRQIAQAVHEAGGVIIMQIHHAGPLADIAGQVAPSDYRCTHKGVEKVSHAMCREQINTVRQQFIDTGCRAFAAGYDGVEIHGCHGYLLCAFLNERLNHREDEYGAHPCRLIGEIAAGIRTATADDFLIGVRLGAFEPTLEAGIAHARELDAYGMDFIDVAYGFPFATDVVKPETYPFSPAVYAAEQIKKCVHAPVIGVDGIANGQTAEAVLTQAGLDLAAVGRGALINPQWANEVKAGRDPGRCLRCAKCCFREKQPDKCPGRRALDKYRTGAERG